MKNISPRRLSENRLIAFLPKKCFGNLCAGEFEEILFRSVGKSSVALWSSHRL